MREFSADEMRREAERLKRGNGKGLRVCTADVLMRRQFDPIRWVVPRLLPEGLMLLAARPKVGKSWLALQIAVAVAEGGEVLGQQVEAGDVLYLALEDSDRRMHARLAKLGAAGDGLGRLQYATEWPRGTAGAQAIADWIAAHPQARLVVIDVFTRLRESRSARESGYTTDYSDVALLKPPPGRSVAILLIHHTRKEVATDPLDEVSGTLGIGGAADGVWVLKRARGSDEAEMHVIGRDLEDEGTHALRFDRTSCRWEWVGEAWRVRMSAERREVLELLAERAQTPAEIADALGKKRPSIRSLLADMARDGQIDRGMDGRYRAATQQ